VADRLLPIGLAALAGIAAWFTLGIQAVVDEASRARVGATPPLWLLAALIVTFSMVVVVRRTPASRLWPLVLTALVCLPWLPGRVPAAFLVWYGPIAALVWLLAVLGLAAPWVVRLGRASWFTAPVRAPWVLGVLCVSLFAGGAWSLRSRLPAGDEPHYLVITQSLLLDTDLRIENNHRRGDYFAYHDGELRPDYVQRGADGQIYSIHAPGVSALVAPAFALAGWPGAVAMMAAVAALTAGLLWRLTWRLTGGDAAAAWVSSAMFALTAPGYFHAFTIFPDGAGALGVALALRALVRLEQDEPVSRGQLATAGVALALLPWLHTRFAVLAGAFGLILLLRLWPRPGWRGQAAALLMVPVVSAAAWFGFFWTVWGTPNPAAPYGQATQSAWSHLHPAVPGLLFDQQFGLMPSAPVYAAAFIGMLSLGRRHRRLAVEIAVVFIGYLLAVGSYRMWWGGYSAPARFLVAVLPVLAVPMAAWWVAGSTARRALTLALLAVSCELVAARVFVDHGALLYNQRDGADLLLEWANRSVDLPLAWPSLHRDVVADAWRDIAIWGLVGVALGGAGVLAARRVGQAWTCACAALALTVMIASSLVWGGRTAHLTPDASALDLLERWPDRTRARGWRSRPYAAIEIEEVLRSLAVGGVHRRGRPPGPAPLFAASRVPAGRYAITTTGGRPSGRLSVSGGDAPIPFDVIDLDVRTGTVPPFVLDLPAGVEALTIKGDEAGRASAGRLTLHPLALREVPGLHVRPARRAVRYDHMRVFSFDDNTFMEPGGFWTRGGATAEILVDDGGVEGAPTRPGSPALQLRAGPVPSTVVVTSNGWSRSVTLQPGESVAVALPPGSDGRWMVRLETRTGFRPALHDAQNSDLRHLGVWVEAATTE